MFETPNEKMGNNQIVIKMYKCIIFKKTNHISHKLERPIRLKSLLLRETLVSIFTLYFICSDILCCNRALQQPLSFQILVSLLVNHISARVFIFLLQGKFFFFKLLNIESQDLFIQKRSHLKTSLIFQPPK